MESLRSMKVLGDGCLLLFLFIIGNVMFKKALATLGLLGWSVAASATANNLDLVNPVTVSYSGLPAGSSFNDQFSFTIPVNTVGAAAAVSLDISIGSLNLLGISNFTVQQDPYHASTNPLSFSAMKNTAGNITGYQSNALATGAYFFDVLGSISGINGGAYTAAISTVSSNAVSAVPLPSAAWLLGSALAGLVSFGRRSKKIG